MFKLRVIHEHHTDPETKRRLDRIDLALDTIMNRLKNMALNLSELKAEAAADTDASSAIATVIDRLVQALEDQRGNQGEIDKVVKQLKVNRDTIVAAALKGTPADPELPVDPIDPVA